MQLQGKSVYSEKRQTNPKRESISNSGSGKMSGDVQTECQRQGAKYV